MSEKAKPCWSCGGKAETRISAGEPEARCGRGNCDPVWMALDLWNRRAPTAGDRHLRKSLKDLIHNVTEATRRMDTVMKQKDSYERGVELAKCANALNMAADQAWHFGLGESLGRKH